MKIKNPKLLITSLVLPQLAGFLGAAATTPNIPSWYASLAKPALNPPNWIFGPVWLTLYLFMGISLYLVWSKGYGKQNIKNAVNVFLVHLGLNSLWSIVFFGNQNPQVAFFVIVLLWLVIGYLIKLFYKIHKTAAYLLIPYLLWVSFATYLNLSIWQLNP